MPKRNGPASDNTTPQRSSRSDKESDNYANLLNQYSQSLDKSADALKVASENFNKTSMSLVKDTEKNNDKLIRAFNEILKAFGKENKELNQMIKDTNETSEDIRNKDVADNLSQYAKVNDTHTEKTRAVGNALIGSFKIAGDYVIKKFTEASHNVISSYNAALSEVTVRQNITNQEYTQSLKGITDEIKSDGLRRQFSQVDFLNSLQTTLSTGLRGDDAERTAYSNLITNKVLPALNTNTTSYTRMSKMFGETFTEGITAVNKYAEKLYGGEGLEQGQADMVLENVYREVAASADSSQDAVNKIQEMQLAYSQYADKYGAEASQDLLNIFKAVSSGDVSQLGNQGGLAVAAADAAGIDVGNKNSLTGENFDKFVQEYAKIVMQEMDNGFTATLSGAFGSNVNTINAMIAGENLGTDVMNLGGAKQGFNSKDEYSQIMNNLGNGMYQNLTDQQTKLNENLVAKFSDTIAGIIPDTDTALKSIASILGLWWAAWRVRSVKDLGGGSLLDLFGKGSSSGGLSNAFSLGDANAAKELFQEGNTFKDVAEVAGKGNAIGGKLLANAGTIASGASLVAGLAMAGHSAYQGFQGAKENGATTSEAWGNAGLSALSGGASTYGWSDEAKLAEVKERGGSIDWSKVGKSALTGGLTGAGIGGLAGSVAGGIGAAPGAAIGGAVGAAAGAISSLAVQFDEMHDLSVLNNKGLGKMTEELGETTKGLNAETESLKEISDLRSEIDTLKESLSDTSEMTALEIAQKERQLKLDEQLLEIKLKEYNASSSDLSDAADQAQAAMDSANSIAEFASMFDSGSFESMDDFMSSLGVKNFSEDYDGKIGNAVTDGNYGTIISSLGGKDAVNSILSALGKDELTGDLGEDKKTLSNLLMSMASSQELEGATRGRNYGNLMTITGGQLLSVAQDTYDAAVQQNSAVNDAVDQKFSTLSSSDFENQNSFFTEVQDGLAAMYKNVESLDSYEGKSAKDIISSSISNITDEEVDAYLSWIGGQDSASWDGSVWKDSKVARFFKLGTDKITSPVQPAYLHENEAVLSAATAEKLREMSEGSGGISGYVGSLYDEAQKLKSTAVPPETSASFDPVIEAISSQTGTLNDSLQSIIELIAQLLPEGTINAPEISKRLLNYSGA